MSVWEVRRIFLHPALLTHIALQIFRWYHVLCWGYLFILQHLTTWFSWAFCIYLEVVSVLAQLRLMQNTKIVEPFTAHYLFALSCKVSYLHPLGSPGSGYSWSSTDCSRLWFVAIDDTSVRNHADVHPRGFVLLLCEESWCSGASDGSAMPGSSNRRSPRSHLTRVAFSIAKALKELLFDPP